MAKHPVSQKGNMPGKLNSQRTNMSKKVAENIRGIGKIFNHFPRTFGYGKSKPLDKVLRLPTMYMIS